MRIGGKHGLIVLLAWAQHATAVKVLSFDISRSTSPIPRLRGRDTGSKSFTEVVQNMGVGNGYTANITVGTPPQSITLGIDTGSTDIWVLSNTANVCLNKTLQAEGRTCALGTFNANKSSTVETVVPGGLNATYLDKSGATGDYITDDLSIAGNTIKGMQMGLAFNATNLQGILGLGYGMLISLLSVHVFLTYVQTLLRVRRRSIPVSSINWSPNLSSVPKPSRSTSTTSTLPQDPSFSAELTPKSLQGLSTPSPSSRISPKPPLLLLTE
jgi:hypothetical protein